MNEKEISNVYAIPANYTDSGKLFGGMVATRNAVETVVLLICIGYPELFWIPVPGTFRIVIMTITLLPISVVSAMGIDGGSLFQYFGHMIKFWSHRRKLHFRRVGYEYDQTQIQKDQEKKGKTGIRSRFSSHKRTKKRNHRDNGQQIHQDSGDRTDQLYAEI